MSDCLFCKIIAGEIPSEKVYASDTVIGFKDVSPQAPVHVLFVPVEHIESAHVVGPEQGSLLGELFAAMSRYAEDLGEAASGYRVVTNVNDAGGQTVRHLHFHLLAGRQMKWPPG